MYQEIKGRETVKLSSTRFRFTGGGPTALKEACVCIGTFVPAAYSDRD